MKSCTCFVETGKSALNSQFCGVLWVNTRRRALCLRISGGLQGKVLFVGLLTAPGFWGHTPEHCQLEVENGGGGGKSYMLIVLFFCLLKHVK